ncbi:hypothetical protein OCH239_00915 [Roseivivax halodurans JCM 10272]|uniref:Uncharacterized protein n=1 Tax=Roseivivax halodurans JCM 10272 TaxID=1449350 RepID=X7EK30_9RHOB|nr:hypothetical protein [Roseivivax halodurans]ETX16429.1 hypothetical protein OCH239_00915 [Roseivivax halodurans JCM 10272]
MAQGHSNGTVARQATTRARLNYRKTILLGVFGAEGQREALIRLPDGRVARVTRGTRIGRSQVVSIDEDRIAIATGRRAHWIEIPGR